MRLLPAILPSGADHRCGVSDAEKLSSEGALMTPEGGQGRAERRPTDADVSDQDGIVALLRSGRNPARAFSLGVVSIEPV